MDTKQLLFDGDIRGYRTGKDCVLELSKHPLWSVSMNLSEDERKVLESEEDGYLEIIDDCIRNARCEFEGHAYHLEWEWEDGSIYAVRDDHQAD
jgi:hypothetical protein